MPKRPHIPGRLRERVARRAGHRCEYCKCPSAYAPGPFDIEHIIPFSREGTSAPQNLAYACNGCNGFKNNKIEAKDFVSGVQVSIFNPRIANWSEHFSWSNDHLLIIGTTATGKATVELLKLNRDELVNIRSFLQLVGEHPPVDKTAHSSD